MGSERIHSGWNLTQIMIQSHIITTGGTGMGLMDLEDRAEMGQ